MTPPLRRYQVEKIKLDITVLEHHIIVSVGSKGDKFRLRIMPDGKGHYAAIVTEHTLQNNTRCIDVPNFAIVHSDLQTVVHEAINEHLIKFHPQKQKPKLTIVHEKTPSNK